MNNRETPEKSNLTTQTERAALLWTCTGAVDNGNQSLGTWQAEAEIFN